jgi:hypothetical protein
MTNVITNVIFEIFVKRNNATQALIVKNANDILAQCCHFATIINDAHNVAKFETKNDEAKAGTDALRDAIIADGHFAWLYDDTGKPNKKGISKPIMSDGMRKIREGMLFLADENNADLFTAWADSKPNKKGVCDFANIKTAIKPKAEKTASDASESDGESDASEDAASNATDAKRTKEEFLEWVFNQAFTEFGMDSADFLEFITSERTVKIADKYTKAA